MTSQSEKFHDSSNSVRQIIHRTGKSRLHMQFANGVLLLWSSSSLRSAKPRDWLHQNFRSLDKFPLNFLQYMGHRISIALSIVPIQYTISTVVSLIHKCHTVVTFPCREARSWDIQRWLTIGNHPTQTSTTLILAPGVCVWQHLPHTSGSGWSWLTEHETWREHLFHLPPRTGNYLWGRCRWS